MCNFSAIGKARFLVVMLAIVMLPAHAQEALTGDPAPAADPAPVQADWRELHLEFPFPSLRTAYRCTSLEQKIHEVMTLVGAHPNTRIGITGCQFDRASGNLFLNIKTAVPVLAPPQKKPKTQIELSTAKQWGESSFPAVWKEVNLARERNAKLRPGDCELIQALVRHVFSQMSVSIESYSNLCSNDLMKQQMPDFKVMALVHADSATDER